MLKQIYIQPGQKLKLSYARSKGYFYLADVAMVVKDDLNLGDVAKEVHDDLVNVAKVVHDDLANVAKVVHDDLADVAKVVPDIVVAECGRQGTESGHRHPENCSSSCACGGRYNY